ncbi:hypothetical protein [Stenotrophomonas mori]|uniref:Polymer-forming cytoskeletal protein n=1 Tax=Stenotrophomonas mori TaxID=2871096 RepID=A0ABT0SJM7_9GAMM|nr:hypothetical protein [Stenotrophomonas mori]MCL7715540.1 hypothetical protein [Stenotrophomonas mori]
MKRLLLLALLLPLGQAMAGDDISKVNGSIRTDANGVYRDLDTVNGSIHLASHVRARDVDTVNGSIRADEYVQARNLETVNGTIRSGTGLVVSGGLETVNGSIFVDQGGRISDDVETVNGSIGLVRSEVGGDVKTVNGDITIGVGSHVRGGVRVSKPTFSLSLTPPRRPRVIVGPEAVVEGTLSFEREVRLYVHESARIGPVSGATVRRFDTESAPRD